MVSDKFCREDYIEEAGLQTTFSGGDLDLSEKPQEIADHRLNKIVGKEAAQLKFGSTIYLHLKLPTYIFGTKR
jgi:hypothetical protein